MKSRSAILLGRRHLCLLLSLCYLLGGVLIYHAGTRQSTDPINGRHFAQYNYSKDGNKTEGAPLVFFRRNHKADCAAIFRGESPAIEWARLHRLKITPDEGYAKEIGSCADIHQRYFYSWRPNSDEESRYRISYAIAVNAGLQYLEILLNSIYAPQNFYCFHVDAKAGCDFKIGLQRLAQCFPNVFVSEQSINVEANGKGMPLAFLGCLSQLAAMGSWRYAITLQGLDFPLKTNLQLVRILKALHGSNDVELRRLPVQHQESVANSKIKVPAAFANATLYKGSVAALLTRDFVDAILGSREIYRFAHWLNSLRFGSDEIFWATLVHNHRLFALPGSYPGECVVTVGSGRYKPWITRFANWAGYAHLKCTGEFRKSVCLQDVQDLPLLTKRHELFLNKFWPTLDLTSSYCMQEFLFNQTYITRQSLIDEPFYHNLASVQHQLWNGGLRSQNYTISHATNFSCISCDSNCLH